MAVSKGKEKQNPNDVHARTVIPSSNWLALQKKISKAHVVTKNASELPPRKKRKSEQQQNRGRSGNDALPLKKNKEEEPSESIEDGPPVAGPSKQQHAFGKTSESVEDLRRMVLGELTYTEEQKLPGKYLAIDCEMVGVGPNGSESSLARASIVNYHGAVLLDAYVRQRERVTDYRTFVSGIRESDMVHAKPFVEVQKQVADLIKDRILIGHAINNDLKALLLSHPRPFLRDTQLFAGKSRLLKTKFPSLRKLAAQELGGLTIQGGEHSSVTDARATMALYRKYRVEWEKTYGKQFNLKIPPGGGGSDVNKSGSEGKRSTLALGEKGTDTDTKGRKKRKHRDEDGGSGEDSDGDEEVQIENKVSVSSTSNMKQKTRNNSKGEVFPGGGRRGVSSGLSVVVKRRGRESVGVGRNKSRDTRSGGNENEKWWKTL